MRIGRIIGELMGLIGFAKKAGKEEETCAMQACSNPDCGCETKLLCQRGYCQACCDEYHAEAIARSVCRY